MITRDSLRSLRADIDAALAEVGRKHNVTLRTGSASFEPHRASFKLDVAAHNESGAAIDPAAVNLEKYGSLYGVSPEMAGKQFLHSGQIFTFLGIDPGRPKRPVIASRVFDGKRFVFTSDVVRLIAA
jgi:hypothetical protein